VNPNRPFVFIFDAFICIAGLILVVWLVDLTTRKKPVGPTPPDAGVPLGAVWRSEADVVTALPGRGEVLVYDRHGQHRATLLDGTWPMRVMVYPPRGEPLLLEVDELGRASFSTGASGGEAGRASFSTGPALPSSP
jgi:hypothetical protein